MCWKNNSLPAFTLLEMIMVMLLSGILLGIVYFGLNIAQTYYNNYAREEEHLKKMHVVNSLLEHDFVFSELVTGEPAYGGPNQWLWGKEQRREGKKSSDRICEESTGTGKKGTESAF